MSATAEQLAAYRAIYERWTLATRQAAQAQHELVAAKMQLLIEHNVPAGKDLDLWGDGTIKAKGECKPPPDAA